MNQWQAEKYFNYFAYSFLWSLQPLMAKDMSQEEAIKIIQVAERARQGRLRAKLNEESRNLSRMYKTKDPGTAGIELAAICIQKVLVITILPHPSFFGLCDLSCWKMWLNVIHRCGGATYRGRGQRLLGMKKWFFWEWWVKWENFANCLKL